jgi:hypothetical protein
MPRLRLSIREGKGSFVDVGGPGLISDHFGTAMAPAVIPSGRG